MLAGVLAMAALAVVASGRTVAAGDTLVLWAQQSIKIPGSDNTFCGWAHSNGTVDVGGTGDAFSGPVEYVAGLKTKSAFAAVQSAPTVAPAPPHDVAWYRALAQSQGRYFAGNGNLGAGTPALDGVVFAEGDLQLSASDVTGRATFVSAHGQVKLQGNRNDLEAAVDGVLAFAPERTVTVSGSALRYRGGLYLPAGDFNTGWNTDSTVTGPIVARNISWSKSDLQAGGRCCADDAGCADGDPCTADACVRGACDWSPRPCTDPTTSTTASSTSTSSSSTTSRTSSSATTSTSSTSSSVTSTSQTSSSTSATVRTTSTSSTRTTTSSSTSRTSATTAPATSTTTSTAPCGAGPGQVTLTGTWSRSYSNAALPADAVVDATAATFLASPANLYPLQLGGCPGVQVLGGTVLGQYDRSLTWSQMHALNNAAVAFTNAGLTVDGLRADDVEDGVRPRAGGGFVVRSTWLSWVRDDCVENDHLVGGLVEDSFFDGCYTAFSARPSPAIIQSGWDGHANVWTIRDSLVRLQPMPGPDGATTDGLGTGGFFKWHLWGDPAHSLSPKLALYGNVFVAERVGVVGAARMGLPPGEVVDCADNVMVWLGPGSYPAALPACFTVTKDRAVWDAAVAGWLARH